MSGMWPVGSVGLGGFCFLSSFFALLLQSTTGRELQSVVAVFRHGDRSPISTFPTNTGKENDWPQGYGQLTEIGMRQQYELGQFIRKRYKSLLSAEYKRKELYVRSTDSDRTLMSALANLAGLYPPVGSQIWNPKLLWQPIPVHTVARCNEKLLAFPTRNCKRFYLLLKETMKSNNANSMMKSQMPFLAEMAGKMGYDVKTLLDFTNQKFWNAYDALLVQKIHGKPLPDWATEHNMRRMNMILAYAVEALFGVHKREEKSRLQGGVLVKEILEKFTKVAESAKKTKLTMYSAHDMTLVALHVALGIFQQQLPPYAACHFFELYKEGNGEYTVEMYYRNTTTSAPFQFTLPGCSATCPLKKFKQLVSPIMPVNVEEECNKI